MYDDPTALAALVAAAKRPLLIGLDIDGVLAPIVSHPDDSRLLDGIASALSDLTAVDDVFIAAISGRALASMRTFGLPDPVGLAGSHGLEEADQAMDPLDADEQQRLDLLIDAASEAARRAGDGALVEQKSASVALHIRMAPAETGDAAIAWLARTAAEVDGAELKHGSAVLELFARTASKGVAVARLAARHAAATTVFVGDDITDEDAFAMLGPDDVAIKVGDAETVARYRLEDPIAVREWLRALAALLAPSLD